MPTRSDKNTISQKRFADLAETKVKRPIKVIMEVGSLNGNDARYLKTRFPEAEVYAIEGLQENFNQFMSRKNDTIHCINAVITDHDGTTPYHVKNINGIHGIFDRGVKYGNKVRQLACCTLPTLRKLHEIPPIDMMKIDVEGATLEVLEGMGDELDQVSIMHLETESVPYFTGQRLHPEVVAFLEERGWVLTEIKTLRIAHGAQYDTVWINPARANDLSIEEELALEDEELEDEELEEEYEEEEDSHESASEEEDEEYEDEDEEYEEEYDEEDDEEEEVEKKQSRRGFWR